MPSRRSKRELVVTAEGQRVHLVTSRWGDGVWTKCGLWIGREDAVPGEAAALSLSNPSACRNCDRSERRRP